MTTAGISPTRIPCDSSRPHQQHSHSHASARLQRPTSLTPASIHNPLLTPQDRLSHTNNNDARSASPNYFGLKFDPAKECESSGAAGQHARANWSPPSSKVRSAAAISPKVIALDQNPEFEAFKRQSELHGFNSGKLSGFNVGFPGRTGSSSSKGSVDKASTASPRSKGSPTSPHAREALLAPKPRSPKRMLSSPSADISDRPRRNSPAEFTERDFKDAPPALQRLRRDEEVRYSLPPSDKDPIPAPIPHHRSDTVPALDNSPPGGDAVKDPIPFTSPSSAVTLLEDDSLETLLLDLRVSTQYARSRIQGALNLCIPTTLLKRPSYTPAKLGETFKFDEQKEKFERWRSCNSIIVYDGNACKAKDALTCMNMLKKFVNEGFAGHSYIIRGGFAEFSKQYPSLVLHDSDPANPISPANDSRRPSLPPVIGGCPMPSTKSAANPFFGNIRQNMDLIGGVGQMPINRPNSLSNSQIDDLPSWLRLAIDEKDNGKRVSDKFLEIERKEQKRMQEALSGRGPRATPRTTSSSSVQVAGLEMGDKNRYNNIWPYEHSRVKLQGVRDGCSDYFNANYVKSSLSKKRYIATQGPIPATFNDFWNVVWQQDVRVIVMLTAEKEGGQVRAHNYWEAKRYGHLHLNFLSQHRASLEPSKIHRSRRHHHSPSPNSSNSFLHRPAPGRRRSTNPPLGMRPHPPREDSTSSTGSTASSPDGQQPYVIVRRFTLSSDNEPFARIREITQLQYTGWPDFGAPAHPAHVLGLVEQCDAVVRTAAGGADGSSARGEPRPVLVHCSAGCGRTGTFCTIDSVLDMLKKQRARREGERRESERSSAAAGSFPGFGHAMSLGAREATPMEVDEGKESLLASSVSMGRVEEQKSAEDSEYTALPKPRSSSTLNSIVQSDSSSASYFPGTTSDAAPSPLTNTTAAATTSAPMMTASASAEEAEKSWLLRDDVDLIEKTVDEFRLQRLSMVQSLRQFVLCYESVLEWMAGLTPRSA